jgi:hypothetical protein
VGSVLSPLSPLLGIFRFFNIFDWWVEKIDYNGEI